jgi:hypothetical protein
MMKDYCCSIVMASACIALVGCAADGVIGEVSQASTRCNGNRPPAPECNQVVCESGTWELEPLPRGTSCSSGGTCDAGGDCVGPDDDGDGISNQQDNCPETYNPDQADCDFDGSGDACDSSNLWSEPEAVLKTDYSILGFTTTCVRDKVTDNFGDQWSMVTEQATTTLVHVEHSCGPSGNRSVQIARMVTSNFFCTIDNHEPCAGVMTTVAPPTIGCVPPN